MTSALAALRAMGRTHLAIALLCGLPSLALAYSETADVLTRNADPTYQGGPIPTPDVHHFVSTPHAQPFVVQDSFTIASSFTSGVNYVGESAVTFANLPLPFIKSHSRYGGHNLDPNEATYATGSLTYSFSVIGAPNAVVPISITSLFELSTNRPTAFANLAFADVSVALNVQDPLGMFRALYGASSSFISMRCQAYATGADCLNRAGDDALSKTLDGVVLPSTV